MNYRLLIASFMLIAAVYSGGAEAATKEDATKFVSNLSSQALKTLGANNVPLNQKEKNVRELLSHNFDLNLIGRYVLGAAWRKASADQRSQYQSLFKEFVLRTYSRRFGGYAGQAFTVTGAKPIGKKDILVSTKIARPSGPPILAGWRVREKNGAHKILDVVVAGVSMVVTQRSEFRAVISKQGVGGLIETLRMQVTKFSAQSK
ncbi:MAG: ABC transporter substrate-binding protein [Rhodospirillaceae bacterium]|nr:ABC transporter substrate-binding protein [Rhodospirillaceae bacterium]MBT4940783.1 ABC transporter substrate-binding protein [Rhodospirillaceae bacterium]MBT5938618.1 ABC transporter substrate-binding protein [Rhodospirillaceae bacterium]MBT7268226.1 ABC transporter substrate-binding protein [Rhodospirillaceae bacterium]